MTTKGQITITADIFVQSDPENTCHTTDTRLMSSGQVTKKSQTQKSASSRLPRLLAAGSASEVLGGRTPTGGASRRKNLKTM